MDEARDGIRRVLGEVKALLAQEDPPKLSKADTKANFIEPVVEALGWAGIGVVTREYYVRNSQEFIDYVMAGPDGPLLAVEAKPLRTDLADKHAAQLVQYCAVEGIEWAVLTNGRELQFFNTFLKPDLAAKRVLRLDLLAFNTDAEYDALFGQVWQLSRESMTKPAGVRTWLHQRRLDTTLRGILLDPGSPTVRQLRKALAEAELAATAQDLAQWFRAHLGTPIAALPVPARQGGAMGIPSPAAALDDGASAGKDRDPAGGAKANQTLPTPTRGVTLRDLLGAGLLGPGTPLVLVAKGGREAARVSLTPTGEIAWEGKTYRSPSDRAFAPMLGVTAFNGWDYWHAELPHGRERLREVRARMEGKLAMGKPGSTAAAAEA